MPPLLLKYTCRKAITETFAALLKIKQAICFVAGLVLGAKKSKFVHHHIS